MRGHQRAAHSTILPKTVLTKEWFARSDAITGRRRLEMRRSVRGCAMGMNIGKGVVCGAASLIAAALGCTAFAADGSLPGGAAQWLALDSCAAYGPGFVSVEGTTACVRIGGHVRVEFGPRSVTYYQYGAPQPDATAIRAIAGGSDFPQPRHVRVGSGESADPFDSRAQPIASPQ